MHVIAQRNGLTRGLAGLLAPALLVLALGGCAVAKPRNDDPWEKFNRTMYTFNDAADRAVIRPVAAGYRKITSSNVRRVVGNFYDNIKMPITIANNVLQGDPRRAAKNTGRFVVNTTLGFAGLFDPASEMSLPLDETDFGVTLAKWGVPEGPYPRAAAGRIDDRARFLAPAGRSVLRSAVVVRERTRLQLQRRVSAERLLSRHAARARHRGRRPARRRLRSVRVLSRCVPAAASLRDLRRPAAGRHTSSRCRA